ncbi:MAG TPA: helix-turn-helix domain-containing protein [Myxococcota bacterium]|nr:helix-turn-helix domain-containing protein [Myxococcota bacterium]
MPARRHTRQRVREARQDAYRSLILESAQRVFAQRGYDAVKVQEIADEAGIATGTVYAIFDSKQELYRAIHRVNLEELAKRYAEIPGDRDTRDVICDRITVSTRFLIERPDYLRIYLREAAGWGFDASALPRVAADFTDPALYRRGVEHGELVDEDPELLQSLAMSTGHVILYHWLKDGMRESADELVERIRAHTERTLFARPLASDPAAARARARR